MSEDIVITQSKAHEFITSFYPTISRLICAIKILKEVIKRHSGYDEI